MEEKVRKKRSTIDKSNLGSSFELEPNKGKKKKLKERKKNHGTDKMLISNETLEENCAGEAAERETCFIEGNITFMRNGEEESHTNKRKKKNGGKDSEMVNSNIADDKEMQFLDDNQQSKMKKRKNRDDSFAEMQEMAASKPSKKGKMTEDNKIKSNEGDPPSDRISTGDANAHSLVTEVDCQGKKMEKKKKKPSNKSKTTVKGYKSNEGDHFVVTEVEGQGKKKLSKKNKRTEDKEYRTNEGDPPFAKSNVVDPPLAKSNEGDQHLANSNEGEDDDQGKKMKKKKKLSDKSKSKENNEFKSNEGEGDDQSKKMKEKKKLSDKSKSKENNEFKSNEGEGDDQSKKMKEKKKLSNKSKSKENNEFKSNEGEDDDQGKKMKKKKKKLSDESESKENNEFKSNEGDPPLARVESGDANAHRIVSGEVDDQSKKMKMKKKTKAGTGKSPNPAPGGTSKPKRVTFSDRVEVCCDGLVRGKRFTPEEDEKIKEAVSNYIESHGLGDEGLDMILHCKSHPEIRDCWKEIGAALPERPHHSIYNRGHVLFERDEKRKWTLEEYEFIRKVQEQHGSDWKTIAEALGKNRFHVKDAWRRIKVTNANKGRWTQEEYQNLFDLVNLDLRVRALEAYRKSKHGMLRDNISWEAIGNKLATRTSARCCKKWYEQLTSPMVAQGVWSDTDDYRLLNALFTLDACCMEEVDWDNLLELEHRSGDVCRKRWNQMIQHIGEHGGKSFAEQVEILAKRFCPDLMEAREAFDSKPVVC